MKREERRGERGTDKQMKEREMYTEKWTLKRRGVKEKRRQERSVQTLRELKDGGGSIEEGSKEKKDRRAVGLRATVVVGLAFKFHQPLTILQSSNARRNKMRCTSSGVTVI